MVKKLLTVLLLLITTACQNGDSIETDNVSSGLYLNVLINEQIVNDKLVIVDENTDLDLIFELSYITENLEDVRFLFYELPPQIGIIDGETEWTGTLGKKPVTRTVRIRIPAGQHMIIAGLSKDLENGRIASAAGIQLYTVKPTDARNCKQKADLYICDWYSLEKAFVEEGGLLIGTAQQVE